MPYQPTQLEYEARRQAIPIPHLRWLIGGMLFLAAILNYIDRQALSILAPTIQKSLGLDDAGYGRVVDLFLIAYTISLLLTGRLVDKLGARWAMAIFITWWSLSNMATGLAVGLASLGVFRFMLGLGEAGNWPASTKVVSEWFPARERALAIGFYTMGATLGATIAPVLVIFLANRFGWQSAFVATGLLGLLWVGPWLWLYRSPQDHPNVTRQEREMILADTASQADVPVAEAPVSEWRRWVSALSRREVWALMFGRLMTDPLWFFYQFWFAKYLFAERAVSQEGLRITWVIYLAADIGAVAGGLASGFFVKRGAQPAMSRLWVMLACAAVMPLSLMVADAPSVTVVLALGMIVVLAHLAWLANISALVVDLIPRSLVATCFGIVAAGSAVGGILMNKAVVYCVSNYSYGPWFTAMSFLHPVAWVMLFLVIRGRRSGG